MATEQKGRSQYIEPIYEVWFQKIPHIMGYKSVFGGLVPTRFLCLTAHLVILISMFIRRKEYVTSCSIEDYPSEYSLDNQIIVALSLGIAFILIELISFVTGISLFNSFQCFLSTIFHSAAAIALSCMVLYEWCTINMWPIFAISSCLPLIFELVILLSVWLCKRPIS